MRAGDELPLGAPRKLSTDVIVIADEIAKDKNLAVLNGAENTENPAAANEDEQGAPKETQSIMSRKKVVGSGSESLHESNGNVENDTPNRTEEDRVDEVEELDESEEIDLSDEPIQGSGESNASGKEVSREVPVVAGIESSDDAAVDETELPEKHRLQTVNDESSVAEESSDTAGESSANSSEAMEEVEGELLPVDESELSSFASLIARFDKRLTECASERKYRTLRNSWKGILHRSTAHKDCADLAGIADRLLLVLREGCESQNVLIVDCCLDLVLRLFEYQYLGTGEELRGGAIVLDSRSGTLDDIVSLVCGCLEVKGEEVYLRMVQTLLTAASVTKTGLHAGTLLSAVRTIYNIFLNAKATGTRMTARVSLTQILNFVFARMEGEATEDDSRSFVTAGDTESEAQEKPVKSNIADESFSSVLQKDAYLLFRALCKLSSKPIAGDALPDSVPSRSKLLSLQLLYNILASSGPAFRSGTRFIYALRSYLAPSLLHNTLSAHMPTVSVALDTLELLVVRESLRTVLKDELRAIIPVTLFRFMSSPHSGDRRSKALSVVNVIADDGQTLADIFLNYDCVRESPCIFRDMMEVIASMAEDESVRPDARMKALATVVNVLKSLRDWIDKKQSLGGSRDLQDCEAVLECKGRQGEAVRLFNAKPKRGVGFLVKKGSLRNEPEDVARWIRTSKELDKVMVGEYLGGGGQFNQQVMREFVRAENFEGMGFDDALRLFLSRFRLPGEAQKIDRLMQNFADRFYECNPDIFTGPDTAHVLAYSCIMLHTDAHNKSIKHKMTAEDFKRNNRGIDYGKDLDPKFLRGLYDGITTTEIKVDSGNESEETASSQASFDAESMHLLEKLKWEFTSRKKASPKYDYATASNIHYARLMFTQTWPSVLSTLSIILERAPQTASNTISLCLSGFRQAIALTSNFNMPTQRSVFVSSLARFTHLDSLSDLQMKNLECIRMVMAIAAVEGDGLGEQWQLVIQAISQVEHIRAIASDNPEKYMLSKGSASSQVSAVVEQNGRTPTVDSSGGKQIDQLSDKTNANGISSASSVLVNGGLPSGEKLRSQATVIATSIPESDTEKIFLSSRELSSVGFTDFISALCAVSLSELSAKAGPTTFSVQKLVETVSLNCEREQPEAWSKSWATITAFFQNVLALDLTYLSLYAVDIARQLAQKWLEGERQMSSDLQRGVLQPFVPCFVGSRGRRNVSIREMVLQSILQITLSKGSDLKGGWRPVLAVLTSAASDKEEDIIVFGWQILERIMRHNLTVDDTGLFLEVVSTLTAYAQNTVSSPIAVASISHLCTKCSKLLSDSLADSEARFSADADSHVGAWFRILTGVAAAASDYRPGVRSAAYDGLFAILMAHGSKYSASLWQLVLRGVLAPILDEVNAAEDITSVTTWVSTSGASVLRSFVEVFTEHRFTMREILKEVISLLLKWITHDTEIVAREGMSAFSKLIKKCGADFMEEDWDTVITAASSIFDATMPYEILGPGGGEDSRSDVSVTTAKTDEEDRGSKVESHENSAGSFHSLSQTTDSETHDYEEPRIRDGQKQKADIQVVRAKCVVQLLLIQLVQDIVVKFYLSLNTKQIITLAEGVERSYRFARKFNADVERRFSLWRTGFMNQVPNLLKQETTGVMTYLRILLWLYLDKDRNMDAVEEKLFGYCEHVKRVFVDASENAREKPDEHREVTALHPVVIFILKGLMQISEEQFQQHLEGIYELLLELMEASDLKEVRAFIRELFAMRIAPLISSTGNVEFNKKRYIPRPQIPGKEREVVLALEGAELHKEEVAVKIQSAIEKISGVSSAVINTEEEIARVYTTATDELLVSALMTGGKVKGANIVQKKNDLDALD